MPPQLTPRTRLYNPAVHNDANINLKGHPILSDAARSTNRILRLRAWQSQMPAMFRIMPSPNYDNPSKLDPGRTGPDPTDLSDFINQVPMVSFVGTVQNGKASFIPFMPFATASERMNNPYEVLRSTCQQALKIGKWPDGSATSGNEIRENMFSGVNKAFPAISTSWFVRAIVYHDGKNSYMVPSQYRSEPCPYGYAEGDPNVILQITGSAGEALMSLISREVDGVPTDENNYGAQYLLGDPVGREDASGALTGAYQYMIYDPKTYHSHPFENRNNPDTPEDDRANPYASNLWITQPSQFGKYEAAFCPAEMVPRGQDGTTYTPDIPADVMQRYRKNLMFLLPTPDNVTETGSGILYSPSINEQLSRLAKAFADSPKLLEHGWCEHPEFFEHEEVRDTITRHLSAMVPGLKQNDGGSQGQPSQAPQAPQAPQPPQATQASQVTPVSQPPQAPQTPQPHAAAATAPNTIMPPSPSSPQAAPQAPESPTTANPPSGQDDVSALQPATTGPFTPPPESGGGQDGQDPPVESPYRSTQDAAEKAKARPSATPPMRPTGIQQGN